MLHLVRNTSKGYLWCRDPWQLNTRFFAVLLWILLCLFVQNRWEKYIYEMLYKKKLKAMSTESTTRFTYTWSTNNCKMWAQLKHVKGFSNVSTRITDIQASLGNVTIMPACKVYSWLDMWHRNRVYERLFTATSLQKNEWMHACMCVCRYIYTYYIYKYGPGSSVGIATDYGLDSPGIESRWSEIFRPSRPALWSIQPPVQWVSGLSWG